MKEATGELSTTAIAVVAIGLILAIFTTILLPMIRKQIALGQACNSGPGYQDAEVQCGPRGGDGTWTCTFDGATKTCGDNGRGQ